MTDPTTLMYIYIKKEKTQQEKSNFYFIYEDHSDKL